MPASATGLRRNKVRTVLRVLWFPGACTNWDPSGADNNWYVSGFLVLIEVVWLSCESAYSPHLASCFYSHHSVFLVLT